MVLHDDNPFYSLGYTTPEQAQEIHDDHPRPTRRTKQRVGRVTHRAATRDLESDRDHADTMAQLPPNFVDEPYEGDRIENPLLVAHIIARRALTARKAEELGANTLEYRLWLQKYNEDHPLPGMDQLDGRDADNDQRKSTNL